MAASHMQQGMLFTIVLWQKCAPGILPIASNPWNTTSSSAAVVFLRNRRYELHGSASKHEVDVSDRATWATTLSWPLEQVATSWFHSCRIGQGLKMVVIIAQYITKLLHTSEVVAVAVMLQPGH
jgi:hypothetical protein